MLATAAAVAAAVAAATLSGCSPVSAAASPASPSASGHPRVAVPAALHLPAVERFDVPATFSVTGGTLVSVLVSGPSTGDALAGHLDAAATSWTSDTPPTPGTDYQVSATANSDGTVSTLHGSFTVTTPPASATAWYWVTPATGTTVGVNAPLVIRFNKDVADRAAVERALTVASTTPVVGAWHWINAREVHFRPQVAWPAHSRIQLDAALSGVRVGPAAWTTLSTTVDLTVGDVHLTKVDGQRHTLTLYVNGNAVGTWPTSLGRPQFATRSGSYIVLDKQPSLRMTSCSAQITCDKANPNYYDLVVYNDVRLTWSGTFIHAAPWSVGAQGVSNVSHGCVNLSPAHAAAYYAQAHYGDLVTVTGTIRGPADLLANGDPGMADWNTTWTAWVAGSATGTPVTTAQLGS